MIQNVHAVQLKVPAARAGALLDTLGSAADALWPGDRWPPMRVQGGLRVEIELQGAALILWPLVFGPLHDALAEDAVDRAVRALGETRERRRWSLWVWLLRVGS